MHARTDAVTFRTLDGLHLAGILFMPDGQPEHFIVLVHGGGVTREEGGFSPGWQSAWPALA